jgi:hypothetical protein
VIPAACEAKKLGVKHVRNPGHGEPVSGVARGERPLQSLRCQPLPDVHVASGVIRIVVVDKIKVADSGVDRECGQDERQINQQIETRKVERERFSSLRERLWRLHVLLWRSHRLLWRSHRRLGSGLWHGKFILSIRDGRRPETNLACQYRPALEFSAEITAGVKRPAILECDGRPMAEKRLLSAANEISSWRKKGKRRSFDCARSTSFA